MIPSFMVGTFKDLSAEIANRFGKELVSTEMQINDAIKLIDGCLLCAKRHTHIGAFIPGPPYTKGTSAKIYGLCDNCFNIPKKEQLIERKLAELNQKFHGVLDGQQRRLVICR